MTRQASDDTGSGRVTGDEALLPSGRRRVLGVLRRAGEADAKQVAEALGLHVTTARFHLDALVTGGLAARARADERRVGRPRLVYRPVASDDAAHHQLAEVLADALGDDGDGGRARAARAGRSWAAARTADADLLTELERTGFSPRRVGDGGSGPELRVEMRSCPFLDLARRNPDVVCSVHRGLIEGVLAVQQPDASVEVELVPFATPDHCLVHIRQV